MRLCSLSVAVLVILAGIGLGPSAVRAQAHEGEKVQSPDAIVHVDGLACPFCAYGLEKKLDELDPIQAMEVQIETSRILVAFRAEKRATEEELKRAVEEAGFSARKIEFPDESPPSDDSF